MLFGYGADKRIIYGLLIALAVWSLMSMTSQDWLSILLTLPAVILAISFHEYAHAKMADKFGDTTPRSQGRLTLNPIKHLDFFGTILMIFAHIGWGKPVQINPNNFNSNKSRGYCEAMVAFAGPLMNFVLAIISCIISVAVFEVAEFKFASTDLGDLIYGFLYLFIRVNIGLGVFNLIPLPPLDGEKIFKNLLPYKVQDWLDRNYYTLYYVFMILWIFGLLETIVAPVISVLVNGVYYIVRLVVIGIVSLFI